MDLYPKISFNKCTNTYEEISILFFIISNGIIISPFLL